MVQRYYHTRSRVPFFVRTGRPEDGACVLALQRDALSENDTWFVRTRAEFDADAENAARRLNALLAQDNSLWIVAEAGEEVIGSLDLHGGQLARIRHVGHFGMIVRQDYRNQGVGMALVETMLLWARDHPIIQKVCTTLSTNNTAAIALYARFGFQNEGRRLREYLIAPGRYLDALLLAKWIK